MSLRYKSLGEVHKDFHVLLCSTIHYLTENYGEDSVETIIRNLTHEVYRSIHEGLKKGDTSEIVEFWHYYLTREGGDFLIENTKEGVRLIVRKCPALCHFNTLGMKCDPILCHATKLFNKTILEDTPFEFEFVKTGDFSGEQIIKKK